jgi:hypothetical protein
MAALLPANMEESDSEPVTGATLLNCYRQYRWKMEATKSVGTKTDYFEFKKVHLRSETTIHLYRS